MRWIGSWGPCPPLGPRRLVCVFGCGGDRDRGKRPRMGEIAGRWCDLTVVTSDNPRSEDPGEIIEQILAGIRKTAAKAYTTEELRQKTGTKGYWVEPDRRSAIRLAVDTAEAGDTVLIAGKGHESYQWIGDEKRAFDDRREARKALDGGLP